MTLEYKDTEIEVEFTVEEAEYFMEDFGLGSQTCYPNGQGDNIVLDSVLVFGHIEIVDMLSDDERQEIEDLVEKNK